MHNKCMVHGDVKAVSNYLPRLNKRRIYSQAYEQANVMIDDDHQARVIDFGLSHSTDEALDPEEGRYALEGFSMRWCAPELLTPGATSTPSSDVYAFASTMLEVRSLQGVYPPLN